uniref:Uncharacterized protein n=1 Tax=Lactuca sativa TaxID=4236 RepID=A0A9R1XN37_LACSA|nr:hypothetical protein LSAT_V11C300123010 [Lactuca sativa]
MVYPQIERSSDTLDMKALGPNTFGIMKQSKQSAKVAFQGLKELVQFGKFAETEVTEEHMTQSRSNISSSVDVSNDDDDDDDDDSDDTDDMDFRLFVPPKEPVNEAVITPAETETEINISRQPNIPTPEQMDALIKELDEPNSSRMPKKRRRRNPRLGVLITEPVQENVQGPIAETTQIHQDAHSPNFDEDFNFVANVESFASGSSSAPPPPEHDVASIKLAKALAFQDSIPQSRGKGICIGTGQGGDEDSQHTISELRQEILILKQESIKKDMLIGKLDVRVLELEQQNSQKNKQISELQANLGGLTTFYFDLKDKLIGKFGDEFKLSSFESGKAPKTSERVVVRPAPNFNIDQYLSCSPATTEERREKQKKNATGDQPHIFIKEVGKRKFADRYDDHSGIRMWGFEADKNMWVVKRRSGNIKYYEKKVDFFSWTKVDLAELIHAPFHNPTNNPNAWAFKKILEDKVRHNFAGVRTSSSFIRKVKGVIDPCTNRTMVNVMWPPTKKTKKTPLFLPIPDGSLNDLQYWVYDEAITTVVIKTEMDRFRLVDPIGLLRLGQRAIHTLSTKQLMVENEMFEAVVKEFTSMIAKIIDQKCIHPFRGS